LADLHLFYRDFLPVTPTHNVDSGSVRDIIKWHSNTYEAMGGREREREREKEREREDGGERERGFYGVFSLFNDLSYFSL
jgi:hypothetical protein